MTHQYIVLSCRYTAQSDEQKESMASLCLNLETGAPVAEMEDMLYSVEKKLETKNRKTVLEKAWIDKLFGQSKKTRRMC